MEKKQQAPAKPIVVSKPFLTGDPYDASTPRTAMVFFASFFIVAIVFLIVCGVMNFDMPVLRILLNGAVVFVTFAIYYSSGISQGTIAVNNGEIMHHRRETGAAVSRDELSRCYHPLKGYVTGLMGTLPLLLCAIVFAFIARRQMAGLGALPSWISAVEGREEIGAPLAFYREGVSLGLEGILRVIIRLVIMPFVNMVGSENADGLLILERVSPLLLLGFPLSFGFGYTRGVKVRQQIHADIARNTRKRARKNSRKKARRTASRGPIELN